MSAPGPAAEVSSPGPADRPRRTPSPEPDPDRAPEDLRPFEVLRDGDRVAVLGSVDCFTADQLAGLLPAAPTGPVAVLDLSGLEFVDVAGCRVLARWAQTVCTGPAQVQVTGGPHLVERMWQLLGLDEIAPVSFSAARP